jgi:hypothetical protein
MRDTSSLGDHLERLAFNAVPGAFTDNMWAYQYDQEPNQVECSLHHKPWTTGGPESNLYGMERNFGCCTVNFNQGWPKFTNSLSKALLSQQKSRFVRGWGIVEPRRVQKHPLGK